MPGSQNFLHRWSRLKRADRAERQQPSPPPAAAAPAQPPVARSERGQPPQSSEPGSLAEAALPAIQSIAANTDIRAFLRAGVPAELTKAALRRAWTADPAIRDFIGIAENQWDFTDPTAIPGFGALAPGEDLGRLVAQALGQGPAAPAPASLAGSGAGATAPQDMPQGQDVPQVYGIPERNEADGQQKQIVEEQQKTVLAATQHHEPAAEPARPLSRRSHGSALPK
jgi:hypothetical protein